MNEIKLKLNVLLAKTDHLATTFKNNVSDYIRFFKDKQSAFKGEKKTYEPKPGTIDEPSLKGNNLVVTTVTEKLNYFKDTNSEYLDALFSQEATNASGTARADLSVDGKLVGNFSSLELLRLKSFLENGEMTSMYSLIPVREDNAEWNACTDEMYKGREVFEGIKLTGVKKSILKEACILADPNIQYLKDSGSYKAVTGTKDTIVELGDYSHQKFSGEWSHRQRAEILRRRDKLLTATIEALKIANETVVVKSEMTAGKLFSYLHEGTL